MGTGVPVVGRVAGLPARVVERLSGRLAGELSALLRLEEELAEARSALADRLHAEVPGAQPALRRLLLAVKRDCHNARELDRRPHHPEWTALVERVGPAAERVVALEARHRGLLADFGALFEWERSRQRRALAAQLQDAAFVRGLALASPDLVVALRERADGVERSARRDARADAALLRYVTRAAVKVSPFSTFTPVAVGALRRGSGSAAVRLRGSGWRARSLVRLRRYLLQQYADLLVRYAPLRDALPVALNDSLVEVEPGCFLFLRPGRWVPDLEHGALRFRADALVRAELPRARVARLAAELAGGRTTTGELARAVDDGREGCASAAELDRLLELGLLLPVLPWPAHEGYLERRMCAALRALPGVPGLDGFLEPLERLVALEEGYASSADPVASLRDLLRVSDELLEAALRLAGVDPGRITRRGSDAFRVYEDVLLQPREERAAPAVFQLSRSSAEGALRSASQLVRLSALFDTRHDLRHTLAALARRAWPGRATVSALELFHHAQPLWRDYTRFRAECWKSSARGVTWNPLGLAEVEALGALRAGTLAALPGALVRDGEEVRLPEEAVARLLACVPGAYTDAAEWGACAFLLPASADGSRWVLSRLGEGTGRFGSRYTPAMDPDLRRRYATHLAARSVLELGGEPVELLDLLCVQGDTLNVHEPQTHGLLTLPGEDAALPPRRRVRLAELRVEPDGPGGLPTLRGLDGRRFLPVHLGLAFEAFIPPVLRFLCAFGPSELSPVLPPQTREQAGDVVLSRRTVLGGLVLRRSAWTLPSARLAAALGEADDARAFVQSNRLRESWGVPERVFLSEPMPNPHFGRVFKPQYVDFGSPLFLPLLRSALEEETVTAVEMLPDFGTYPRDGAGERRALEVLVDSVALRPAHARAASLQVGALAGRTPASVAGG